jgi:hypothetical protein
MLKHVCRVRQGLSRPSTHLPTQIGAAPAGKTAYAGDIRALTRKYLFFTFWEVQLRDLFSLEIAWPARIQRGLPIRGSQYKSYKLEDYVT